MKLYSKLFYLTLGVSSLTACVDMDTEPEGSTLTGEQKEEIIAGTPERLEADVNGLYAGLITYGTVSDDLNSYHFDFGYPAACIMTDGNGMDVPAPNTGYNWFSNNLLYTDRNYTGRYAKFMWRVFYNHIKTANDVLAMIDAESEDASLQAYRGQALASRAFDYLNLVQLYQFTYADSKELPAVPIITDKTTAEETSKNPRATVEAVYTLIMDDLNNAIACLDGYVRSTKGGIDRQVAYGLRARANLLMENWEAAASDARAARDGYSPLSIAAAGVPGFNSISLSNWIWGAYVDETSDVVSTGIINYPSWLCSFTGNGYSTGVGVWFKINNTLYDKINSTDVRKGWWVDKTISSPLTDALTYGGKSAADFFGWEPYTNVKFGAYQNTIYNSTNACDWPMMRVEEMLLIEAEAVTMSQGAEAGKALLTAFVTGYRDPSYTCNSTTQAGVRDAIWTQRRIELWGEGFSFQDCLRLKKDIVRVGTNYPIDCQTDYAAGSSILLWRIPEEEITANAGISVEQNNK